MAFCKRFAESFGAGELALLEAALRRPLCPSIRLHPHKSLPIATQGKEIPWCSLGRYLEGTREEVVFGADPLWHGGAYYVQEPASMFVAQYIEQLALQPRRVLDLCAAPGGKASLLRSYLPTESLLVANEIEPSRARILLENLTRMGLEETINTSATPQKLNATGITFDLILVDVPCSGEGMFRKEPRAIEEWSEANVALCVDRQRDILDAAWEMLSEEGVMLYSTCTYNRKENEEQLSYLSDRYQLELIELEIDPSWGVQEYEQGVYRFMPHHTESEGLTIFGVRKKEQSRRETTIRIPQGSQAPNMLSQLFDRNELYEYGGTWHHLSREGQAVLSQLKGVRILSAGVGLVMPKGKDLVPLHSWVSSSVCSPALPYDRRELSLEDALRFLKREPIAVEGERGYYVVEYLGLPLGLVKHIGNRSNNLYPRELAIKNRALSIDDVPFKPTTL